MISTLGTEPMPYAKAYIACAPPNRYMFFNAEECCRGAYVWVYLPVLRRRCHEYLFYSGKLSGHNAHNERRRICRGSAGNIDHSPFNGNEFLCHDEAFSFVGPLLPF